MKSKTIILGSDRQADKVFDMLTEVMGTRTGQEYAYSVSRRGRKVWITKAKMEG